MKENEDDKPGLTGRLGLAIFSAVLGMLQFGYQTTVINAPRTVLEHFYNESYQERYGEPISENLLGVLWSLTVSVTAIGGMIGALSSAPWSEKFGRKNGMLFNTVFGVAAAALMSFSYYALSYEMIILGRLIVGFHCGLYTGLAPVYNSEISAANFRGAVGTLNQLAVTVGLLLAQVLSLGDVLGTETLWPVLFGLTAVVPAIQLMTLPCCPESPTYLLLKRREEEKAIKALRVLRGSDDVRDEIEARYEEERATRGEREIQMCKLCDVPSLRVPLLVGIVMHLSQQFSGINCIFYYSTSLFEDVGLDPTTAQYASLAVGSIMVTMTIVTIPLMDRAGRKVLHLIGLGGMFLFSLIFTITYHFSSEKGTESLQVTSVVMALVFVVFFAVGPGSIPWMIMPEFFSQGPRQGAVSIGVLINWLANFVVAISFPPLQEALQELVFVPFTVLLLFFFLFLLFLLPETKGKSYEEIAAAFSKLSKKTDQILAEGKDAAYISTETYDSPL